jgi:hypothetical protein
MSAASRGVTLYEARPWKLINHSDDFDSAGSAAALGSFACLLLDIESTHLHFASSLRPCEFRGGG